MKLTRNGKHNRMNNLVKTRCRKMSCDEIALLKEELDKFYDEAKKMLDDLKFEFNDFNTITERGKAQGSIVTLQRIADFIEKENL